MEKKSNELENALTELEKLVQEFAELEKITNSNKQGKINLSDAQMQKLEEKYINLTKKMEILNKNINSLKNGI